MSLQGIFDPMVRAYFKNKYSSSAGTDTGDLGIYTIPKSAIDMSEIYTVEGLQFYRANVEFPTDDLSKGVIVLFDANLDNNDGTFGFVEAVGLWGDNYSPEEVNGLGSITVDDVPVIFWFSDPELGMGLGLECGVYVSPALAVYNAAILYPKA